jgi:putative membrane-bound dehydrogenase-like protein
MRTSLYLFFVLCVSARPLVALDDPPGFPVQPGDGLPPAETAAGMKVPDGFSVKVFAAEPDIVQPITFAIDDRGRLWVCENLSYPDWKPEGNDRIVILEDTDGDGKFDKKTLFYDKLNNVSGIEIGFGGVWVGSNPNLFFIADKNGDDKPDGPPEVVLDGWGHEDMHEILNSFAWGPDGWLYGTQGVFTQSNVGKPGAPDSERTRLNCCVWRLHPQTRKFEVFAHGTSNPWGVDWNDYGQCFITACVIPHLYHIIQGGIYQRQGGKHFNPYFYEDIKTIARHRHWAAGKDWAEGSRSQTMSTDEAGGGHAHAGAMVYLGDSWPEKYRNTIFMNNIHGNRINNDSLTPDGSGYGGDRLPDFMKSTDKWYRGLAIKYGPDGSVFVSDWYDARACHQQTPHDRRNGRIYKIVYNDAKQSPVDLAKLSDAELVKLQLHRNDWFVRHARRLLQERGPNPEVHQALKVMIGNAELTVPQRLRALWALQVSGGFNESFGKMLLADKEPWLRAWSVQFLCEKAPPSTPVLKEIARLARLDDSPNVRLYVAAAMQRLPLEDRWDIASGLASHPEQQVDPNLTCMIWFGIEPAIPTDPARSAALIGTSKVPKLQEFIARRMASVNK